MTYSVDQLEALRAALLDSGSLYQSIELRRLAVALIDQLVAEQPVAATGSFGALARSSDPDTSHAGAGDVEFRLSGQRLAVLEVFDYAGEQTAWSMQTIGVGGSGPWKRISELRQMGWLDYALDTEGRPKTRMGGYGSQVHVYRITELGRTALAYAQKGKS